MASVKVCLQWLVIAFNTLSVILGILGIVAGIYDFLNFTEGSFEYWEKIIQLVAASMLLLSGFIGCCGAVNGSLTTLSMFIVILLGLIASHSWKLWRYNEVEKYAATENMVTGVWIEELVRRGQMSKLQEKYECCGKRSYTDFTSLGMKVPISCYRSKNGAKAAHPYGEGCMSAVTKAYMEIYRYGKWTHVGLIGFEILGILLASLLIFKIATKQNRYRY